MPTRRQSPPIPAAWEAALDPWLAPFVEALGDPRRQPWLAAYVRGLLSRSERKSLSPMADHVATQMTPAAAATPRPRFHHLQHFITYSPWETAPLRRILAQRADALLGGPDAVLIVDDTALRKHGTHSVWVAHQYCGEVGKLANCQCLVSLTLAQGEVPLPLALRLYLPAEWTDDPERCDAAGIPATADPTRTPLGRLRVRPVASEPSQTVAELVRGAHWQTVRIADGEEGAQREHMPGDLAWLVAEQQPDGKRRYYFTNHPARWSLKQLVAAIRTRWVCEQAHQQLKQELGLDHFEGRSWCGLEHHTFLTMLSFAFLQHLRLRASRGRGENPARPTGPAAVTLTPDGPACPHCQTLLGDALLSPLPTITHVPPVELTSKKKKSISTIKSHRSRRSS